MSNSPEPSVGQRVIRAQVAVGLIALAVIGLFVGIWIGLGELGIDDAPRLFAAFCIPPILLALGASIAYLHRQPRSS